MRGLFQFLVAIPAISAAPHPDRFGRRQEEISRLYTESLLVEKWLVKVATGQNFDTVLAQVADVLNVDTLVPTQEYHIGDFHGFALEGSEETANAVLALDSIELLQQDQRVKIDAIVTQENPTYGLARISNRGPGGSNYSYDSSSGTGSFIYVVDTGINAEHEEFGGRAVLGRNFISLDVEPEGDQEGHGTHCAGTAAGATYGVAKNASIIAVKVFDSSGEGALSILVSALDWVLADATANGRVGNSVVSLSLGVLDLGPNEQVSFIAAATKALVDAGMMAAVASGNFNIPVNLVAPANVPEACTVGAIDSNDVRGNFSNFGAGVDIHAAGVDVLSAGIASNTATAVLTGTSMACPHVAGLGAYLLGLSSGMPNGAALCNRIIELSIENAITDVQGSPNRIAYNGL